jgi:flagellar FliL protein
MAPENKEAEGAESAARKGSGLLDNKVIVLGILVTVQALLAFGLTQFVIVPRLGVQEGSAASGAGSVEVAAAPEIGALVGLEEIIVTLQSDTKVNRYLRTTVNVEVANQDTADLVAARLPQLRDTVIMILSAKTPAEIQRPEGKKALRDELFRRLSEKLPAESLRNVYFSDLVIQ